MAANSLIRHTPPCSGSLVPPPSTGTTSGARSGTGADDPCEHDLSEGRPRSFFKAVPVTQRASPQVYAPRRTMLRSHARLIRTAVLITSGRGGRLGVVSGVCVVAAATCCRPCLPSAHHWYRYRRDGADLTVPKHIGTGTVKCLRYPSGVCCHLMCILITFKPKQEL